MTKIQCQICKSIMVVIEKSSCLLFELFRVNNAKNDQLRLFYEIFSHISIPMPLIFIIFAHKKRMQLC